jgi:hypothetical protein
MPLDRPYRIDWCVTILANESDSYRFYSSGDLTGSNAGGPLMAFISLNDFVGIENYNGVAKVRGFINGNEIFLYNSGIKPVPIYKKFEYSVEFDPVNWRVNILADNQSLYGWLDISRFSQLGQYKIVKVGYVEHGKYGDVILHYVRVRFIDGGSHSVVI